MSRLGPEYDRYFEGNRANWDERVPIHLASQSYDMTGFLRGEKQLTRIEREEVGDVRGKRLLHLQCHFGMDTLSWARLGATVTGLDISPAAIEAATRLATYAEIPGTRFVTANVYDAPDALGGETFDIVYTGIGALNWLPDVDAWAQVVAACVAPGGRFYILECHPVLWSLDNTREDEALILKYPYFETAEPGYVADDALTYTDGPPLTESPVSYEWNHGLGEIIDALLRAGLRLDFVHEHQEVPWQALPWLVPGDDPRTWVMPEGRERVPLTF
ncbi:MAG: class I SAM-dependent methyltransferase, partial [Dehalococcoidia bacterium]